MKQLLSKYFIIFDGLIYPSKLKYAWCSCKYSEEIFIWVRLTLT